MSHNLGRIVPANSTFDEATGLDLNPSPGPLGGPRFVILHFDNVNLNATAKLKVELGYDTDIFTADSGPSFWSRPVDTSLSPIPIRIVDGVGSARLREYGSGEPTINVYNNQPPPGPCSSRSNPDPFLHTDPYQEPIYETRLQCNPGFAWRNAACSLPSIPLAVKNRVAAATGIIVMLHNGHVSSCTGTLIASDLFLTARHCLTDPTGEDVRSASVTFDYATTCDTYRPSAHVTRFFKVLEEVHDGAGEDWVILRLDAEPGALPSPLEMRETTLMNGEVIFTMHHPNGSVKKTQAGVHDGGSISGFDYAGGSSGSALFDVNGRLVRGPLSNGGSCLSSGACSVYYIPILPIKQALANPPAPPAPLDVMIVFDRSGSMASASPPAGRTKLEEAQDAAALFVQLVREGQSDRIGLVTFSSTAALERSLGPVTTVKPLLVGPPPFVTGDIGAIEAGGSTSIGAGIGAALLAFGSGSTNDRAILLLSDGMQNTAPTVEEIEGFITSAKLCVIGFGSDAEIDGPLLSRLAREHDGDFTRALDGLSLRKFFGLCFGNIFESGTLGDPEYILRADQEQSDPHNFGVCGEERITLVLGWDNPSVPLDARIYTPSGNAINERRTRKVRGRTWVFWSIPLPHRRERDGTWHFTVHRLQSGDDVQLLPSDVRYFYLVIGAGRPKLTYIGGQKRLYTGDPVDPLVRLQYPNGTTPKANVDLTIEAPTVALGQLVMESGLRAPVTLADTVDGFHATLQTIQNQAGGVLPVATSQIAVPLFDDGSHNDGAMEPDGIYNHRLEDLTRAEGTYHFRAVATYGSECVATREATWSIHIQPGIDSDRTNVRLIDVTDQPDGRHGTLVIEPRDFYGNPFGPGRLDTFSIGTLPGTRVGGKVKDRGDGSYGIHIVWDVSETPVPSVLVHQPDRNPVPITPPADVPPREHDDCADSAGKLLECLGLQRPDVERVSVKSVCFEVDLKESKPRKGSDC